MNDDDVGARRSPIPFLPYAAVGIVHVAAIVAGAQPLVHVSKWFLMPTLALAIVWAVSRRADAAIAVLLVAVGLSWVGDVTIDFPGEIWFVVGLGAFLVAHLAYVVLFVRVLRLGRPSWWGLGYALWYAVFLIVLAPSLGALFVPVAVYGLVLGGMALAATRGGPVLAVGGVLFVASDTLLALAKFLPGFAFPLKDALVMLGYIAAQGLIGYGVTAIVLRRRSARSVPAPLPTR